jgi:hypothetical protein
MQHSFQRERKRADGVQANNDDRGDERRRRWSKDRSVPARRVVSRTDLTGFRVERGRLSLGDSLLSTDITVLVIGEQYEIVDVDPSTREHRIGGIARAADGHVTAT